jgi:hypothetical protein
VNTTPIDGKVYRLMPEVTRGKGKSPCRGCSFYPDPNDPSPMCTRPDNWGPATEAESCGMGNIVYVEDTPEAMATYVAARMNT